MVMVMARGRANVKDVVSGRSLVVVIARHADRTLRRTFMRAVVGRVGDETGELVCVIHARGAVARVVVVGGGELSERFWDGEVGGRGDEEVAGVERAAAGGVGYGGGRAVRRGSGGRGGGEMEALLTGEDLWLVGRVEGGGHRCMR
jgi:hypothetical protein